MHSFQPSRGRIFFEVLCAVGIAASCGGAWMQTGASALLAAAAVSTLYGLVHFFDLFRRAPSVAAEPQRMEFEPEPAIDVPVRQGVNAQLARVEEQLANYQAVEEAPVTHLTSPEPAQPAEPAVPTPAQSRRTKAPRKGGGRRAGSPKKAKAAEPARDEEIVDIAFPDGQGDIDRTPAGEPLAPEEPFHPPVAPLFEPEPFVRQQQRAMFGRKSA